MQQLIYKGKIRDGAVGTLTEDEYSVYYDPHLLYAYLDPMPIINYEDESYRVAVNDSNAIERYYELHQGIQDTYYQLIKKYVKPGDTVLEVGCGGGILLDTLRKEGIRTIGVEPNEAYQKNLRDNGHIVYSDIETCNADWNQKVDVVLSFHVIEHVHQPEEFIRSVSNIVRPGGLAFILTPNYHDVLLTLNFSAFAPFFFRKVHPVYLTIAALRRFVEMNGMEFLSAEYFHEFGLSNMLYWLRDDVPKGHSIMPGLDDTMDEAWKDFLVRTGQTKDIAVVFRKSKDD